MSRRVVFAELDEHVALVPALRHELQWIAVARLEVLVRVQAQPKRHGTTPAVRVVAQVLLALEEDDRPDLLREMQRVTEAALTFRVNDQIAIGQTGTRLRTI